VSDRTELAVRKNMQGYLSGQIGDGRKYIEKQLPQGAVLFGKPMSTALQAMEAQNKMIQEQILDAETPESPVAGLARQDQATRLAMNKAMKATNAAINAAGDRTIASLQLKAFATLGFVALALLAAAYLFMGFTRGTRNALHSIGVGARALAAGQFADRIHVDTRDELHDIGRGMEDAAATLRKFAQAQQSLFEQQQAGDLDSRIDAENFPGAFGVMAEQVNALVGSFIDENLHMIEVIGDYGRGDLSRDVNRMPGKKADAVKSVDAVKASLLAVNGEIQTLVDAAVAGDFSKRGDASRFDFVYRELVERLDLLMATSQNGLNEVGTLLSAVADGDLSRRIEAQLPGQFGQLAADANRTVGWPGADRRQHPPDLGRHQRRGRRDRCRQQRPVDAHRTAGRVAGGNRLLDGRTDLHGQGQRRQRPPGQPAGAGRGRRGRPGRRGGAAGGGHDERHRSLVQEDRRHHQRDRRHRLPDQHPGAECRGGSCARR